MKKKKHFGTPLNIIVFFVLFFGIFASSHAGNPELIVTWKADNFYPTSYTGKAIPSYGTKTSFAVEAIQDGKLLDISKSTIEWRKNGERIKKGEGQKEALVIFSNTDRTSFVSVSVLINGTSIEKSISIPITEPRLVIEIPYKNLTAPKNSDISITATPYFFNATSLNDFSFSWNINGIKKGTGTNNKLTLNTGNPSSQSDSVVTILGYAQNKKSLLEIKKTQAKLFISD